MFVGLFHKTDILVMEMAVGKAVYLAYSIFTTSIFYYKCLFQSGILASVYSLNCVMT